MFWLALGHFGSYFYILACALTFWLMLALVLGCFGLPMDNLAHGWTFRLTLGYFDFPFDVSACALMFGLALGRVGLRLDVLAFSWTF